MEDKPSNIILKGRNALRPDEIDLDYLINECKCVNPIEDHEYDVHVDQLDFTDGGFSCSDSDLRDLFDRTNVRSVDKVEKLKLIDLSETGIGLKETAGSGDDKERYVYVDGFVDCINRSLDREGEDDGKRSSVWSGLNPLMRDKYESAQCSDKKGFGYLKRVLHVVRFQMRIAENVRYGRNGKTVFDVLTRRLLYKKMASLCEFTSKVVFFSYRRRIPFTAEDFYSAIGLKYLPKVVNIMPDDIFGIIATIAECECVLKVYETYLSAVLSVIKEKRVKKAIDLFTVDYAEIKKLAINRLREIPYERYTYFNFNVLFDRFIETVTDRTIQAIDNDIKRRIVIDACAQYVPSAVGGIMAIVLFVCSFVYNYTLLKEFDRRATLLVMFAVVTICGAGALINLYRNAKRFNRPKRKKFSLTSLASYLAVTVLFFGLYAYFINRFDGYDKTYYYVYKTNGTIQVDGLVNSESSKYVIPEKIDGYKVSVVARRTFSGNKNVKEVSVDGATTDIQEKAFKNCTSLVSFNWNSSNIPDEAFRGCTSLTSFTAKGKNMTVGRAAFRDCVALDSVPVENFSGLSREAFCGCKSIGKIGFNEKLKIIPEKVFMNCNKLSFESLPQGLVEIQAGAFSGCLGTKVVDLSDGVTLVGKDAFKNCGLISGVCIPDYSVLSGGLKSVLGDNVASRLKTVEIGNVNEITDKFFCDFASLQSVKINSIVDKIGNAAFKNCRSLVDISLAGVSGDIGAETFDGCVKLETFDFGDSEIKQIGDAAFRGCEKLTTLAIFPELSVIGEEAFSGCSGLDNVELSDGVKKVGAKAFYGCGDIGNVSLNYYDGFGKLGDYFDSSTSASVREVEIRNMSEVPDYFFSGFTAMKSLNFDREISSIGDYAFSRCINLTDFGFVKDVKKLGKGCFDSCVSMTNIDLSDTITDIPDGAFAGCHGASGELIIPKNIRRVGAEAFKNCSNIDKIVINGSPSDFGNDAFIGMRNVTKISLNAVGATLRDIFGADVANKVDTVEVDFGECKEIPDRYFESLPRMVNLQIGGTITRIGEESFANCAALARPYIPSSVSEIGSRAFANCGSIENVDIGTEVKKIGNNIFAGCEGIKSFNVPIADTVTFASYIPADEFNGNKTVILKSTVIPDSYFMGYRGLSSYDFTNVVRVGNEAFASTGISEVKFSAVRPQIGGGAFSYCTELSSANLGGATLISDNAFSGCTWLTSVAGIENVKEIGDYAFENCSRMKSLVLPDALDSIGSGAFRKCTAFTEVNIPLSVKKIGNNVFAGCNRIEYINAPLANTESFADYISKEDCSSLSSVKVVTEHIPDAYFKGYNAISSYNFDGVAKVGAEAFCGTNLTRVSLGTSVNEIGSGAFRNNTELTTVDLSKVSFVPDFAFEGCTSLDSVKSNSSIGVLGDSAFKGCALLRYVDMDNCSYVGQNAFEDCKRLSVSLGNGIGTIKKNAFKNCSNLSLVEIDTRRQDIAESAFSGASVTNKVVFAAMPAHNVNYYFGKNSISEFEIHEASGAINKSFFKDCKNVHKIVILGNVTEIGDYAFDGMEMLSCITLSDSVITIGNNAFQNCTNLNTIIMNGVENIGDYAFNDCKRLTEIVLPDTVKSIGNSAFRNCSGLNSITMNGVKRIGNYAFKGCASLTDVTLPGSVEYVGNKAFSKAVNVGNANEQDQPYISEWDQNWHYSGALTFGLFFDNIFEWISDNMIIFICCAVAVIVAVAIVVAVIVAKSVEKRRAGKH